MSHELTVTDSTKDFLTKFWGKAPQNVVRMYQSMRIAHETKYVTLQFDPAEYKTIELIHITDVQYGHLMCNKAKFIDYRDWILAKKNRFVLFGGDMVDAATVMSVASPFENTTDPQGQVFDFCQLVQPMRHRILGYVGGNHERRGVKTFGDLGRVIATLLQIPYSAGQQFIDISYGEWAPFKVHLWHGIGSAKTSGAKMQMMDRFYSQGDSHLYLVGHLHDSLLKWGWRQIRYRNRIKLEKKCVAMSSSFLDFWGTYAESAGLTASDTLMTRCILEPTGHFEITMR